MGHNSSWSMLIYWEITYIDTIQKITETLIDASKEVGLEGNTRKTKYTVCCCLVTRMQGEIMI
jgi:hypothetical protein